MIFENYNHELKMEEFMPVIIEIFFASMNFI